MATLTEIMAALDDIGVSARRGDVMAVNTAIADGKTLGLTDEQIHDAVQWGSQTAPPNGPALDMTAVVF